MAALDPNPGVVPEHPRALGVFLKAPRPGAVKTRLGKSLGMEPAAELYRAFSMDILEEISLLQDTELWVFYSPATAESECRALIAEGTADGGRFRFSPQEGLSLGERMARSFRLLFSSQAGGETSNGEGSRLAGRRAVLVGSDTPTLSRGTLRGAFQNLELADVVFGPSADGGYYLVGLRSPQESLFLDIPWSGPEVLKRSLERARTGQLRSHLLKEDSDIDRLEDLKRLWRELQRLRSAGKRVPGRTFAMCQRLAEKHRL